jgi:2-polyprenyl-3-methyl-5-hydroxy-6-metoxy-1,4-benzoquinol methylase
MEETRKRFIAKDHLLSGEEFEVVWNESLHRAETQLPPKINLAAYYETKSYISHQENRKSITSQIYFTVQKWMLVYKASIIRRNLQKGNILDFGGGTGAFSAYLGQKKGYKTSLIEPNDKARAQAVKKGVNTYKSVDKLPNGERFDLITLWHVLEHIEQPEKIIKELSQRLEDHGKLILAVPNFESFDAQYYKAQWAALDVPRHLWHFAPKGIIKLLENANFTFKASHPLWFDAFYIASLSEKYSNKKLSFLRGMFIGLLSNIKALFNGAYSSLIFVFEKETRTSTD